MYINIYGYDVVDVTSIKFSYNDGRDIITNMIGLNYLELATLPAKIWSHYLILCITLYSNEYYLLK